MPIDNQSEPGSWEREWDSRSHTSTEYRVEINELRVRIRAYLKRIEELENTVELLSEQIIALERQINQWGRSDGS